MSLKSLETMIITNNPDEALFWQGAGVDIIFIDMEVNGKQERQGHLNSVKSNHTFEDIKSVKSVLRESKVLTRINPFHDKTKYEIDKAIDSGTDIIMLPMFEHEKHIEGIIEFVSERAEIYPLIETMSALKKAKQLSLIKGVSGYHFGLNDLHIQYSLNFMFEMMCEKDFKEAIDVFNQKGVKFGIGGVSTLGAGILPADTIMDEYVRLGSQRVILSRSFKSLVANRDNDKARKEVEKLKQFYDQKVLIRNTLQYEKFKTALENI